MIINKFNAARYYSTVLATQSTIVPRHDNNNISIVRFRLMIAGHVLRIASILLRVIYSPRGSLIRSFIRSITLIDNFDPLEENDPVLCATLLEYPKADLS